MAAYYNEIDPNAADWIELLIKEGLVPNGIVDRRSISEVKVSDLAGHDQIHFFSGVAGWALALRRAGWPDDRPVWTGSCPCQPFSCAGKGEGEADERHLWPEMFRLVEEGRPAVIFGEQVASADVVGKVSRKNGGDPKGPPVWIDGVFADLESASYATAAIDLPAACVNAPHIRQRLFWLGLATDARCAGRENTCTSGCDARQNESGCVEPERAMSSCGMGNTDSNRRTTGRIAAETNRHRYSSDADGSPNNRLEHAAGDGRQQRRPESGRGIVASGCSIVRLGDTEHGGRSGRDTHWTGASSTLPSGAWDNFRIINCTDNKSRRSSTQCSDEPLAYGIPSSVGPVVSALERMGHSPKDVKRLKRAASQLLGKARRNRVVRLKGYGNAIVDVVAAEFIRAFMEIESL